MVELTHQTLTMSYQLVKPRVENPLKNLQGKSKLPSARANQSTNHLIDRGANGGLAGADMRVLQKIDRKINIVGIHDHELTGLDVVTTAALFHTQDLSLGVSMNMLTLTKGDLFMLLDRLNALTAKLMTDPRLEVPRELKLLMDIFFHFPFNLVWLTCTPSRSLLMMIFNDIPMVFHIT